MKLKVWQAVNTALWDAMSEDDRVIVFGQDVGNPGGPFGMTRGLLREFGPKRVRDAPISEAALVACGTGAAIMGLRPIVEIMYIDFMTLGMDQLVNQAAKYRFFTQDKSSVPLVIHTLYGGRSNYGAQHSQSLESWICHVPGLKVAFPSNPQDEYGILRTAIKDPDPVIVITSIALLRGVSEVDTSNAEGYDPGTARQLLMGDALTIITYGPCVEICQRAVEELGIEVDLIDLRWLQPWDDMLVRESLRKTSRLLVVHDAVEAGGWGAEIVARLVGDEFWSLDAPPRRVGAVASPIPVARQDWQKVLPSVETVKSAIADSIRV